MATDPNKPFTPPQIERSARWLRKRSDALLVLIVTANNVVIAEDPRVTPRDLEETLRTETPNIIRFVKEKRTKKGQR